MCLCSLFFFFKDTATTEIYTLSLHDALPICRRLTAGDFAYFPAGSRTTTTATSGARAAVIEKRYEPLDGMQPPGALHGCERRRSEEHTSELQSRQYLVCRLLLEKKKRTQLSR